MKKILIIFFCLQLMFLPLFQTGSAVYAADIPKKSNESIIFEKVKSGIVTILGADFGSGFLIDEKGLILTS